MDSNIEQAKRAIDKIFSDTSVSPEETLELLGNLLDDIEIKMEALAVDIGDNN